jgi:hypothetical protein
MLLVDDQIWMVWTMLRSLEAFPLLDNISRQRELCRNVPCVQQYVTRLRGRDGVPKVPHN